MTNNRPKDIYNREINPGDFVVFSWTGRYSNMTTRYIVGITPTGQLKTHSGDRIVNPSRSCVKIEPEYIPEDIYFGIMDKVNDTIDNGRP